MVSLTAANTSRILVAPVACVRLEGDQSSAETVGYSPAVKDPIAPNFMDEYSSEFYLMDSADQCVVMHPFLCLSSIYTLPAVSSVQHRAPGCLPDETGVLMLFDAAQRPLLPLLLLILLIKSPSPFKHFCNERCMYGSHLASAPVCSQACMSKIKPISI